VDKERHLLMVPVRQRQNQLLVEQTGVRILRVVDDQRTTDAIGVLPADVGMIPISAGLVDLRVLALLLRSPSLNIR